jgi:DnaJ-class molecular chaperone
MTHKLYDVLGVSQDCSKDDLKRAYKKMAVQHHPDKGGDPEKFKEIANAYDVLMDDQKRQMYDQLGDERFDEAGGAQGGGAGPHIDPHSIFEQFFGGAFGGFGDMPGGFNFNMHQVRKSHHLHQLNISLEDAYKGIQKSIKVSLTKICRSCKEQCYACQGKGHVMDMRRMGFFTQMSQRPCDVCNAAGYVAKGKNNCKECSGSGVVKEDHKIELNIPAGVSSGHHMVFKGLGEQAVGDNEVSGDLVFEVAVGNHPVFQREGADLSMTIPLTFVESVVGKEVNVPHFSGDFVLNTQEFGVINPTKTYIVKGKGMSLGGNLIVKFTISYPTKRIGDGDREKVAEMFKGLGI